MNRDKTGYEMVFECSYGFYASLVKCMLWGCICNKTIFLRKLFTTSGHSLSMICILGYMPFLVSYLYTLLIVFNYSSADFFRGSSIMELQSWSYTTMVYLFPLLDVSGKRPVWSLKTFPLILTILVK